MPNFIPIPGPSDDARAVHTRAELAAALIALMHEKSFDEISVQEICERAEVGRSTFYAHFQDREELFIRHTVVFGHALGERLAWDDLLGSYRFPVRGLLAHVRQMKPLFVSLSRSRKVEFILKVWHTNIAEGFERRILEVRAAGLPGAKIPADLLARQLSGTLMTLIDWWMQHHYPLAEHDMEDQFHRLIAGIGP